MRTGIRNLSVIAAVLIISVIVSSVAFAQDATGTVEPSSTTAQATAQPTNPPGQPNNPQGQPSNPPSGRNFAHRGFGFFNFHNRHGRGMFGRGRMRPFMHRLFNGRGRGAFGRGGMQPFFNGRGGRGSFGRGRMFPFMQPFFNGRGTFGRGFLNNRNAPRQNGQPLPEGRVI